MAPGDARMDKRRLTSVGINMHARRGLQLAAIGDMLLIGMVLGSERPGLRMPTIALVRRVVNVGLIGDLELARSIVGRSHAHGEVRRMPLAHLLIEVLRRVVVILVGMFRFIALSLELRQDGSSEGDNPARLVDAPIVNDSRELIVGSRASEGEIEAVHSLSRSVFMRCHEYERPSSVRRILESLHHDPRPRRG